VLADPNRFLCVQQLDLRFFNGRFVGQPMAADWTPPSFDILAKSKKVADFTSWQISSRALLVSIRARDIIRALEGCEVEFLPFATIKGVELFAMNVLTLVEVVDWAGMERVGRTESGPKVLRGNLKALPPIFKDRRRPGDTYASDALGRLAVAHGLTGLRLADPRKNIGRMIVHGEGINEYPGL
jgi:hypothetical protein